MDQVRNTSKTSWIKTNFTWWLLIAIGIALRLRQYLANRSFWADEASLALNIVGRSFSGLTLPLDYEQGAPILFLLIEKLSIVVLGNKDFILRLFPLLAGLLSVYLIYRVAQAHLGTAGIFALLMSAVSWPLIYYSSELKQYGSDVMVALLLVYLAGRCLKENVESKDFLLLGIAGAVAIWISHPAALILAGIGLVLLLEKITRKDYAPLAWILGLGIAWTGSFGIEYFVSFRHLVADEFLQNYWRKAFIPIPPWNNKSWFIETYYSLLLISLDRTDLILVWLFLVLMIIGGLSLLVRNRNIALIIILPFFMALLASALQKYPLKYRFMLFLVPFVFLLAAEGLGRVYSLAAKWNRTLALILCGVSVLIIFWIPAPITFGSFLSPFRGSDIKPVMEYVSEHRNPNDIIYVFHGADPAFSYYAPFYDLDNGKIVMGFDTTKKKIALQNFFDDVDKVKGNNRVWFIFSGIIDCGGCEGDMQTFYIEYLNNFGTMLDEINASGANAYLYDLSR